MAKKKSVKNIRNSRLEKTISKGVSKRKDSKKIVVKALTNLTDCNVVQYTWRHDETVHLLKLVLELLIEVGSFSYSQIQRLDWNQINVDGRNTTECKNHINQLRKSFYGVTALDMILSYVIDTDIEKGDNKMPMSAFMLFCHDIRNKTKVKGKYYLKEASAKYRNLSDKEKLCYKLESRRRTQKYRQITRKIRKIIITPVMLYQEHYEENNGELDRNKLKKQFKALANSEKLEWIRKAVSVNANEDGKEVSRILNKNELSILRGEPIQPLKMHNLFLKMKYDEGMNRKTALNAYRQLKNDEKDVYRKMSRQAEIQYTKDLENFISSLSPEDTEPHLTKLRALKQKIRENLNTTSVYSNENVENLHKISENNTWNDSESQQKAPWKKTNCQKRKSTAENASLHKRTTVEHLSQSKPGYGSQKVSREIKSEQTDNIDSNKESQQKSSQKNVDLQKRRLNTKKEAICISTTMQLSQHTSGYVTTENRGAQLIKSKPMNELSSDNENDNKSQLQIPKHELNNKCSGDSHQLFVELDLYYKCDHERDHKKQLNIHLIAL